jgi:hypothetical protein
VNGKAFFSTPLINIGNMHSEVWRERGRERERGKENERERVCVCFVQRSLENA